MIWSSPHLTKTEIDDLDHIEFEIFRNFFKQKYEDEAKEKQKFIENTFEFANKAVETICKTIAGAYGTKAPSGKIS